MPCFAWRAASRACRGPGAHSLGRRLVLAPSILKPCVGGRPSRLRSRHSRPPRRSRASTALRARDSASGYSLDSATSNSRRAKIRATIDDRGASPVFSTAARGPPSVTRAEVYGRTSRLERPRRRRGRARRVGTARGRASGPRTRETRTREAPGLFVGASAEYPRGHPAAAAPRNIRPATHAAATTGK